MASIQDKIGFIIELDKLKAVLRQTKPVGLDRFENSAEHSWQAALTALVLLEDADPDVEPLKVLKMMLIHDVVEIDAGDVYTFDEAARTDIAKVEARAATRLFGMLPGALGEELLALWHEFEDAQSPSAKFAKAIDRVCPVLQNLEQQGQSWNRHNISRQRVLEKSENIADASPELWNEIKAQLLAANYFEDGN